MLQPTVAVLKSTGHRRTHALARFGLVPVFVVGALLMVAVTPSAQADAATVGLGSVGSYSVLGGTTVTNTGPSTLDRGIGVSPGSAITGFPPGIVGGAAHAADAAALQAQADLGIAYDDAAGRASDAQVAGNIAGETLTAGVYTSAYTLDVTGTLTLDAQGDSQAVFIFQVASALSTGSGSTIRLTNGAQACNVFWQVGSSATINTATTFVGTVMALTSITVGTGSTIDGRMLARNGQVSLDTNSFISSPCNTDVSSTSSDTATGPVSDTTGATDTAGGTTTTATATTTATDTTPATSTDTSTGTSTSTSTSMTISTATTSPPVTTMPPTSSPPLAFTGSNSTTLPTLGLGVGLLGLGSLLVWMSRSQSSRSH